MDKITQLICNKIKIFYIVFDKEYKMKDFNSELNNILDNCASLKKELDVRDAIYELVGLEEEMKQLFSSDDAENHTIHIPMVMKKENYYDLDVETFISSTEEKYFILYIMQKPEESLRYTKMIQEINKKNLIYEEERRDFQEHQYELINKKLLSFNVDLNGIITKVNRAFTYFFNRSEKEIIGNHFSSFFQTRDLNFSNKETLIFNAINPKNEVISFHADIIPVSEGGVVYENIIICQDITYLKQIEKELQFAAWHDSLTGLPNRSQLLKKIDQAIENRSHFTLCFVDLDKFKPVNDTYGHHAGDMLLKHIARLLSNFVREDDIVARIGGDEFIILFHSISKENEIKKMVQRLYTIPEKNPLHYTNTDIIEFGFSIGYASYPHDASDAQELLNIADQAMYENKKMKNLLR